jgi:hypothetical protein
VGSFLGPKAINSIGDNKYWFGTAHGDRIAIAPEAVEEA